MDDENSSDPFFLLPGKFQADVRAVVHDVAVCIDKRRIV